MGERFLFDQEFDSNGRAQRVGKGESFDADELAAARAQAFAEGQQAAETAAQQAMDSQVSAILADIAEQLRGLQGDLSATLDAQKRDATEIAVTIGRRLAESLMAEQPLAETEAMIAECLSSLSDEPRLVIRASDKVAEKLRDRIDPLAAATGFEGQLVLLPEEGLSDQACRVEWADGGATRDPDHINAQIDAALRSSLGTTPIPADAQAGEQETSNV